MHQALWEATKLWGVQKGAQYQNSPCRGCKWYASQIYYHKRGTTHDCKRAIELIEDMEADMLLADRGYDSDEIIAFAESKSMVVVIPSKKNRRVQRKYDKYIYKLRHLVENAFLKLKRWRGIATRYVKTSSAFHGAVALVSIVLWLHVVS